MLSLCTPLLHAAWPCRTSLFSACTSCLSFSLPYLVQLVTYWQTQWLQAAVIGAVLILCALPTAQLADTQGCNQLWPFTLQRLLHLLHTCGELLLQTVMHRQIWWQQAAVNESMLKFCNLLLQAVKHWQTWWPPLR